jgi:hypothetical protein
MDSKAELPVTIHKEKAFEDDLEPTIARDYSGAILSVDPIERKLVKKLDWRIMVR